MYSQTVNIKYTLPVRILCTIGMLLSVHIAQAQAPFFSQYNSSPLMLNPAMVGDFPDYTLQTTYRIQRLGQVNYHTGYFAGIMPLYQQGQEETQIGGIGLAFVNDVAGEAAEVQSREIHLASAYNLLLNRFNTHVISFGIQGAYAKTFTDYGNLYWPTQVTYNGLDQNAPSPGADYEWNYGYVRISAGAYWSYDPRKNPYKTDKNFRLYLGFAADNLNQAQLTPFQTEDSPVLLRIHGGSEHFLNYQFSIEPGFMIQRLGSLSQYTVGSIFNIYQEVTTNTNPLGTTLVLQAGAWCRVQNAAVFMLGMKSQNFQAALSYDVIINTDRATINNQQALELSLSYRFLRNNKPTKINTPLF